MHKIALMSLVTAAGVLGAVAPAAALTTAVATPAKAGKPSTLHFDIDGAAPPISGRIPQTLQFKTPPGFRVNLQAIAKRCSEESAKLNECPAASLLGKGALVVGVTTPTQVRTVTIPLNVYLHSSTRILSVAKVFGWQVVPGTLVSHNGLVVSFSALPQGPPFQGVTYALDRITLDFGATRVITKRVGKSVRRRRLYLIKEPGGLHGELGGIGLVDIQNRAGLRHSRPRCRARSDEHGTSEHEARTSSTAARGGSRF